MKPSIALPHNRLPNAPTPEFSRHILAPRPIPLHTQTSQTSSLPFKPVRLLRAPLAAPPGACRLRSALPSVAPSSNRQPFLSVAFHHLSGANLAAFSGQASCYLLRSLPTILLPTLSHCIHRPAKRACSPSSTSACSALPLQHSLAAVVSAPCSPRSTLRQPSAVLGRPHSPA